LGVVVDKAATGGFSKCFWFPSKHSTDCSRQIHTYISSSEADTISHFVVRGTLDTIPHHRKKILKNTHRVDIHTGLHNIITDKT
jgi:hypothetical protein